MKQTTTHQPKRNLNRFIYNFHDSHALMKAMSLLLIVNCSSNDDDGDIAVCERHHHNQVGFHYKNMGVRSLDRMVENEIKRKLADQVLFGELEAGGDVEILLGKDKKSLDFKFHATPSKSDTIPKSKAANNKNSNIKNTAGKG